MLSNVHSKYINYTLYELYIAYVISITLNVASPTSDALPKRLSALRMMLYRPQLGVTRASSPRVR
jgi:hypothetical protein